MFAKLSLSILAAASILTVSQFAQAKATTTTPVQAPACDPGPTSCPQGFELVFDLAYGKNTCVIAPDPNLGNGGGGA